MRGIGNVIERTTRRACTSAYVKIQGLSAGIIQPKPYDNRASSIVGNNSTHAVRLHSRITPSEYTRTSTKYRTILPAYIYIYTCAVTKFTPFLTVARLELEEFRASSRPPGVEPYDEATGLVSLEQLENDWEERSQHALIMAEELQGAHDNLDVAERCGFRRQRER